MVATETESAVADELAPVKSRRAVIQAMAAGTVGLAATACEAFNGSVALPETNTDSSSSADSLPKAKTDPTAPSNDAPVAGGSDAVSLPVESPATDSSMAGGGAAGGDLAVGGVERPADAPVQPSPTVPDQPFKPPPYRGNDREVVHVANRLTFGITPKLRQQIESGGADAFIEDQLAKAGPDPALEDKMKVFPLLNSGIKYLPEGTPRLAAVVEMTHSNVVRATYSEHQLYEMMVHLWMDHFNINTLAQPHLFAMFEYQENVIRPHAMGKFRDLLVATANSWAMMVYLNNFQSNAYSDAGVNENYGRELLELHSLGIHPDGSQAYTEDDIRGAALVMSGWSTGGWRNHPDFGKFRFRDDYHYKEEVSLLDGAWTTAGLTGKARGDSLLRFVANHESTAKYVAYKLARRFISDAPPQSVVDAMARIYLENDTAIVPMLRHLFKSQEFKQSAGLKLRRPFEFMAAALRITDANLPVDPMTSVGVRLKLMLQAHGHDPWGWPQPNGYSENAIDWITTDSMMLRWSLAALVAIGFPGWPISWRTEFETVKLEGDVEGMRPQADTVDELITKLGQYVGIGDMAPAHRSSIAEALGISTGDRASAIQGETYARVVAMVLSHPLFQIR